MWARQVEANSWANGNGIQLLTADEAREYAESAGLSAAEMERHGFSVEEG
jgi:hypothetical protein